MQRVDSLEKTLMLGGIGGRRRRGRQRMRWLDGITDSMDVVWVNSRSWWWTGVLRFMGSQRVGHDWVTDLIWYDRFFLRNSMSLLILPICSSMLSTYPFSILLIIICFPDGLVKNPPANAGYVSSIPGPRIPPGVGSGNPLQYFCPRNPIDRGPLWATVYGVTKELDMT